MTQTTGMYVTSISRQADVNHLTGIYMRASDTASDWRVKMQAHMNYISSVESTHYRSRPLSRLRAIGESLLCTTLDIACQLKYLSTMSQVREYFSICYSDADLPGLRRRRQSVSHMRRIMDTVLDTVDQRRLCGGLSFEVIVRAIAGNCDFSHRSSSLP